MFTGRPPGRRRTQSLELDLSAVQLLASGAVTDVREFLEPAELEGGRSRRPLGPPRGRRPSVLGVPHRTGERRHPVEDPPRFGPGTAPLRGGQSGPWRSSRRTGRPGETATVTVMINPAYRPASSHQVAIVPGAPIIAFANRWEPRPAVCPPRCVRDHMTASDGEPPMAGPSNTTTGRRRPTIDTCWRDSPRTADASSSAAPHNHRTSPSPHSPREAAPVAAAPADPDGKSAQTSGLPVVRSSRWLVLPGSIRAAQDGDFDTAEGAASTAGKTAAEPCPMWPSAGTRSACSRGSAVRSPRPVPLEVTSRSLATSNTGTLICGSTGRPSNASSAWYSTSGSSPAPKAVANPPSSGATNGRTRRERAPARRQRCCSPPGFRPR
jgi:hypothetical protein